MRGQSVSLLCEKRHPPRSHDCPRRRQPVEFPPVIDTRLLVAAKPVGNLSREILEISVGIAKNFSERLGSLLHADSRRITIQPALLQDQEVERQQT